MISVNNLSVQFTGTNLFDNVTFNVSDRDRVGLVGKNGAGKSTLLKILCGWQQPETGTIIVSSGQEVGYLPQEMVPDTSRTVMGEALTAFSRIDDLVALQQQLAEEIAERTDYESDGYARLLARHADVTDQIMMLGADSRQENAEKVLLGLGFRHTDFHRSVAEFSGGWQMRVELAKLLLEHPDFLLLDEPTNHLDIESIQWLEHFLQNYQGAVVLVSHDRTFLDNVTNRTIEITAGRIYDYRCSYSEYVVQMQERRASQMAQLTAQQRQVAQIEAFIERFRYKATKSKQVQSRVKMLEKMEMVRIDEVSTESIHFQFPPAPHSGKIVVEAAQVGMAYGSTQVFDNVDFLLTAGRKVAFVGKNGEGKSTMAKIIVGEIGAFSGMLKLGAQVKVGYYAQNQAAMLDGEKTVFQTIDDIAVGEIRPKIRSILGQFLFDSEDCEKKVKVLSGGEKARLALAKLLLTPANLLVLDEPTNHLDMDSKDILKNALLQYGGTLILVSHDRDFLDGLTDALYEFRDGAMREFKSGIYEFLEWRESENAKQFAKGGMLTAKTESSHDKSALSQGRQNYEQGKDRDRELRRLRNAVEKIEQEIEKLERMIAEQEAILASGASQDGDFYAQYQALKSRLDQQMEAWEDATIALDAFQNRK